MRSWLGIVILLGMLTTLALLDLKKPEPSVVSKRTREIVRLEARRQNVHEVILPGLTLAPDASHQSAWRRVLYRMKATGFRPPESEAIPKLRPLFAVEDFSGDTKRLLFEAVYALYEKGFEKEMMQALLTETAPRRFCMAAAWLERCYEKEGPAMREDILSVLTKRFPDWRNEPRFEALHAELTESRAKAMERRPALKALLNAPFEGKPVLFSLQRMDRNHQGRAILRDPEGNFVREADGNLFSVGQLARAVNNLPGTITNGNTPQGIFEVRKFGQSSIGAIGPTPTIELGLPGEYDKTWTFLRYLDLLPKSWQQYWPIHEAWWAGKAGRFDIIAHGTTKDPYHWRQEPFYPNTPSHGCLTALETWDPGNGQRLISEQARLVQALKKVGGPPGWLVVIEIDDQKKPITRTEAAALVQSSR